MSTLDEERSSQASDEDWMEGEVPPPVDRGIAPAGGWDNPADVAEAKRYLHDMRSAVVRGQEGVPMIHRMAQYLRDLGIRERTATKLIMTFNKPPIARGWVGREVHVIYLASVTMPGLRSKARPHDDDQWQPQEDADNDDWMEGPPRVWPRPMEYDTKQNVAKLLELFLSVRPGKLIASDGVIYSLDDETKIWRAISEEAIAAEMRATDPALSMDTDKLRRMARAIHVECLTQSRPFEWIDAYGDEPSPNDLILFRNGVLDFESGKLSPLDGRLFATGLPEFDFQQFATCPTWDRCLGEWLDPSFHDTLHEFMGYVMTPDTRYEKLLALIGARRGGKSTVLRVLSWLVGPQHVISRTLNDLGGEFGLESTLDKKLMIIPDASDTDVGKRGTALDRIKCISGNDEVSVNRKNVKIVAAKLPTRLAIAANRHPKFLDDSGALAARELLLIFERSFEGKEDRDLSAKLRDELPGIANRALEGLERLRKNGGKFTVGAKGRAASRELAESQSPALRFAKEWLIVTGDPDDYLSLATVYAAYEEWAIYSEGLGGREKRSRDDFKNDLVAALMPHGVQHARRRWHDPAKPRRGKGVIKRGLFGLRMKADHESGLAA